MPGRFVHDVRRRRVFDVMDLPHVARDHQDLVSLKFHERRRRNKSVHRYRAPVDLGKDVVHFLNARDALKRDAGVEEPLEVNFVRILAQEKSVLTHDESPHGMIDRRVIVVTLIDGELQKMLRRGGDGRVIQADPAGSFHRHLLAKNMIALHSEQV